jgi:glycosyltransferase involved in cell wall biosynthesis
VTTGAVQFRVVVPAYQAAPWIGRCLGSIREQEGVDLRCIVLDDHSPDATFERAREAVAGDERFTVARPEQRQFALANIVEGVRRIATDPEDVVVTVDGDDWLHGTRALERVARAYERDGAWLTYGSYWRWRGRWYERWGLRRKRGVARAYPREVLEARAFRTAPWRATHLRTFKRFLWDAVRDEDLREADGSYFRAGWDLAFMFPMLEMAGKDHVAYVDDLLYVYNETNPLGDWRVAAEKQRRTADLLRAKPPYSLLVRRPEGARP